MDSIKKRLVTVILLTVFIPFIAYAIGAHFFSLRDLEKRVMQNSMDLNRVSSQAVQEHLRKLVVETAELADRQEIRSFDKNQQKKVIEDAYKRNDFIRHIFITDENGMQIARSTGLNVDNGNRSWFRELKKDLQPIISEAHFSDKDNYVSICIVQPIIVDGQLKGALVAEAELSGLKEIVQRIENKKDVRIFLLDEAGNVFFRSDKENLPERLNLVTSQNTILLRDGNGEVVLDNLNNFSELQETARIPEKLSAAAKLAVMGEPTSGIYFEGQQKKILTSTSFKLGEGSEFWSVLMEEDYQTSMDLAMDTLRRSLVVSILQLMILILLALYITGMIVRPVSKITEGVRAIKNGKLEYRIDIQGKDEFSQLGEAFNGMASSLMESYEQQMRKNRELKGINMELEASNSQLIAAIRQLNESEENLRSAFRRTVQGLISAVEAKDLYTESHSIRVANYSVAIAERMGLGIRMKEDLWIAGVLHDIGKIGITDLILNKVGRLNEEEYREIKQHPVIACKMLSKIDLSRDIMEAIRYHHERFDGKGYPDCLKGKEIPEMASIISVADAFDAITSTRSYRNSRSIAEGIDEIVANAGTQFNIEVVSALLKLYKEKPEVLEGIHADDNIEMLI